MRRNGYCNHCMRRNGKAVKGCGRTFKWGSGISAFVIDMYCVKPLDAEAVVKAAENAKAVLTVEEHAPYGGLGSMVSQIVGSRCRKGGESFPSGCSGDHGNFKGSI